MLRTKAIYEELEQCTDDHKRLVLLFDLATAFLNFDEKRSLETAEAINELAAKLDSNIGRAYYHSAKGRVLYKKSLFGESAKEFNKALDKAMLTDNLTFQAVCLDTLSVVYSQQQETEKAIEASYRALEVFQQQPNTLRYQAISYNNIGNAYKRMLDYAKAEEAYLQGLVIAREDNDERTQANVLNNLAAINIEQENFKQSLGYAKQALAIFKNVSHKHGEVHSTVFLGHTYVGLGEYAKGMDCYLAAQKLLKQVDHKPIEIHIYKGMADVYVGLQAYDEAIKHYQKAAKLAKTIEDFNELSDMYYHLGNAYQAMGNLKEAIRAIDSGIEASNLDLGKDSKLPKLLSKRAELGKG